MKHIFVIVFLHYLNMIKSFTDLTDNFERVLGEDPQYVYNKTIQSKSSTIRNDGIFVTQTTLLNSREYASTPKHSDSDTLYNVDDSSGSSLKNILYTPPVLKNINSPFEDRLTLRGSHIDTSIPTNRRLQMPPILPGRMDKDRIPIKGPDVFWNLENRKKTINTSVQKLPKDFPNNEFNISRTNNLYPQNSNTLNVVIPAMNNNNITVMNIIRMLDGNNNNENNFMNGRYQHKQQFTMSTTTKPSSSSSSIRLQKFEQTRQHPFNPVIKVYRDYQPANDNENADRNNNSDTNVNTDYVSPQSSGKSVSNFELNKMNNFPIGLRTREILGIGWNFHVYFIGVLFFGISCLSVFALIRLKTTKWLLHSWYFIVIHILLIGIGSARSCYLLYDAYNVENTFSNPINRLLLNIVHPFFISIFSIMLMFILRSVDIQCGDGNREIHYDRITNLLLPVLSIYSIISILLEFYGDIFPFSWTSYYLSKYLFTTFCVIFGLSYIKFYNSANRLSFRKQNSVYGTAFTDPLRPCVAHALRVMFAISLLCLLMAAVHVIEILSKSDPINVGRPHPWIWWAFQLSISVIEVSICYLIFWAAIQRLEPVEDEKQPKSHSGFPLFPYNSTRCGGNSGSGLLYPSVCNTHLTVYNCTMTPSHLSTASKPIYEDISQCYDSFSTYTSHSASAAAPSTNNFLYHLDDKHVVTTHQQSYKKYRGPKNRRHHSMVLDYHNSDPPPLPLPNPPSVMSHDESQLKCKQISIEDEVPNDEEFEIYSPEPFGHPIENVLIEKDCPST